MDWTDDSQDFVGHSASFVAWFQHAKGTRLTDKIRLADLRSEGAGRGVVALQDLDEDEELFAIPRHLVLAASTSSIPPEVLDGLDEHGSWPPLIVTIIYEYLRGEESPWLAYFQVLPSAFDSLMFWTDSELEHLQASAVVRKIGKAGAEASWKETIIPAMLKYPQHFTVDGTGNAGKTAKLIELAHMAGSLIMAYAFDIDRDEDHSKAADQEDEFEEDDEDEPLKGMVPFADMLNADADRNNARLFQEDDYLLMKTTKPVRAGEQLFNDYGPLPRSDLLRTYGYVTANYAQYDVVEFEHDLFVDAAGMRESRRNADWVRREEQLDEIGIIDDGYSFPRPQSISSLQDAVPGNIHMLLRALTSAPKAQEPPKMRDESVSIEEAALLSTVAMKKLAEYTTSLQEDQNILQRLQNEPAQSTPNGTLPRRYISAIQVRVGEKEILQGLIELCQAHIATKTSEIANGGKKRKHDTDSPTSKKTAKTNGTR